MKSQFLTLASVILVLCLSACNLDGLTGTKPPDLQGNTVIVTPAIGPNTATLQVGDTLELRLATIPSEGFAWVVDDLDTSILVQQGEGVYTADPSPDAAGGIVTFRFKAVGVGETHLGLSYISDETDDSPSFTTNSFGMTVTVTEQKGTTVIVTPAIGPNAATLKVGETLEVQIPTIPTEGYTWVVDEVDTDILAQQGEAVYTADPSPDAAGGIVSIQFLAVGAGETHLGLSYISEETEDTPSFTTNTFGMTVTVSE